MHVKEISTRKTGQTTGHVNEQEIEANLVRHFHPHRHQDLRTNPCKGPYFDPKFGYWVRGR